MSRDSNIKAERMVDNIMKGGVLGYRNVRVSVDLNKPPYVERNSELFKYAFGIIVNHLKGDDGILPDDSLQERTEIRIDQKHRIKIKIPTRRLTIYAYDLREKPILSDESTEKIYDQDLECKKSVYDMRLSGERVVTERVESHFAWFITEE